ncbi:unnamed protein product, partial [Brugia timori]|uniref:Secreted protein n=1 Tax=Brugia timori TaxID=42155 RepID=A0A0R3Q4C4_9BILA
MVSLLMIICVMHIFLVLDCQPIISCYFQMENPSLNYLEENLCTHYNLIGSCTIDEHHHVILPNRSALATTREWLYDQRPSPKLLITLTPVNSRMSHLDSILILYGLLHFRFPNVNEVKKKISFQV